MERTARAGSGSPRTAVESSGRSSAPPGGHAPLCLARSGSLERPSIPWPDSGDPHRLPHADGQKASDLSLISRDPLWLSREIGRMGSQWPKVETYLDSAVTDSRAPASPPRMLLSIDPVPSHSVQGRCRRCALVRMGDPPHRWHCPDPRQNAQIPDSRSKSVPFGKQ
jgi:hypothetical protein